MLGWLLRLSLLCVALAGGAYLTFVHRLGERTLYQHLDRIADTEEAHALYAELTSALDGLTKRAPEPEPDRLAEK